MTAGTAVVEEPVTETPEHKPKQKRKRKGKTVAKRARRAGVSTRTGENVERAHKADPEALDQIAKGKTTSRKVKAKPVKETTVQAIGRKIRKMIPRIEALTRDYMVLYNDVVKLPDKELSGAHGDMLKQAFADLFIEHLKAFGLTEREPEDLGRSIQDVLDAGE
jgi:transcriptional regulator with XRE-family HTH domain